MRIGQLSLMALVALAACGPRQPLPPVAPSRVSAAGDTSRFGPGVVGMSADGRHVDLKLGAPAFVLFYNVHPDGWAELLSSARLTNGEREFVVPLTAGAPGAGPSRVPFTVSCTGSASGTATEQAAARAQCAEARAAADNRTDAALRSSRSPRAGYRDVLVVVVWDRAADDPQLLSPDAGTPRLFDTARPAEALPQVVLQRPVPWAAWAIAP